MTKRIIHPTIIIIMLISMTGSAFSWTIGQKGRTAGLTFHTTHFLTSDNQPFQVEATAYLGNILNGSCLYLASYKIGSDSLKTGESVDLDGFALKSLVGGGYECMVIFYRAKQVAIESLQLFWDGKNYIGSFPPTSEVLIS